MIIMWIFCFTKKIYYCVELPFDVQYKRKAVEGHLYNVGCRYMLIQLCKKFISHTHAHISWAASRKQEVKCLKFKNWLIACLLYDVNEGRIINKGNDRREEAGCLRSKACEHFTHSHAKEMNLIFWKEAVINTKKYHRNGLF